MSTAPIPQYDRTTKVVEIVSDYYDERLSIHGIGDTRIIAPNIDIKVQSREQMRKELTVLLYMSPSLEMNNVLFKNLTGFDRGTAVAVYFNRYAKNQFKLNIVQQDKGAFIFEPAYGLPDSPRQPHRDESKLLEKLTA